MSLQVDLTHLLLQCRIFAFDCKQKAAQPEADAQNSTWLPKTRDIGLSSAPPNEFLSLTVWAGRIRAKAEASLGLAALINAPAAPFSLASILCGVLAWLVVPPGFLRSRVC